MTGTLFNAFMWQCINTNAQTIKICLGRWFHISVSNDYADIHFLIMIFKNRVDYKSMRITHLIPQTYSVTSPPPPLSLPKLYFSSVWQANLQNIPMDAHKYNKIPSFNNELSFREKQCFRIERGSIFPLHIFHIKRNCNMLLHVLHYFLFLWQNISDIVNFLSDIYLSHKTPFLIRLHPHLFIINIAILWPKTNKQLSSRYWRLFTPACCTESDRSSSICFNLSVCQLLC